MGTRARLIFSFSLAAAVCFAQNYDFSALDRILTQAAAQNPPGIEVLILQNGAQIYYKQFGSWPANNKVPVASGTKSLSAAVVMSLVDDGILPLDDPASKYLSYMTGDKAGITLRQLFSHTAGIRALEAACLDLNTISFDDCARQIAALPLEYTPGTGFAYTGNDMQIGGRMAEAAAQVPWQQLVQQRITGPLGMSDTDFEFNAPQAMGPTTNPRIGGGARSTAKDYGKLWTMFYQRGMWNGKRILSTRAVDQMFSDQTNGVPILSSPYQNLGILDPLAPLNRYGLGIWREDVDAKGATTQFSDQGFVWLDAVLPCEPQSCRHRRDPEHLGRMGTVLLPDEARH